MKEKNEKNKTNVQKQSQNKSLGRKLQTFVDIRKDYVRKLDGKSQLYINMAKDGDRKKIYLKIFVAPENFSKEKQRVLKKEKNHKDINLFIEKSLARIYQIELEYRLRNQDFTLNQIADDFLNPGPNFDFFKFWEKELDKQKGIIKNNTYRQQKSSLNILMNWKGELPYGKITNDVLQEMIRHLKRKKLADSTIYIHLKNFKKFLHLANEKGYYTGISYKDIKVKILQGKKIFLTKNEIKKIYNYYNSEYISEAEKNILDRFLFSIFTGIRISDIQSITRKNINNNTLLLTTVKTSKIQQIPLNKSALKFIDLNNENLFKEKYTDQHINRVLKRIAKKLEIRKNITFHVARHTFATQWLLNGGDVVNLQAALGHSNIRETMTYVHLISSITEKQFNLLDNLLN